MPYPVVAGQTIWWLDLSVTNRPYVHRRILEVATTSVSLLSLRYSGLNEQLFDYHSAISDLLYIHSEQCISLTCHSDSCAEQLRLVHQLQPALGNWAVRTSPTSTRRREFNRKARRQSRNEFISRELFAALSDSDSSNSEHGSIASEPPTRVASRSN